VSAMHEELHEFTRNDVWTLVTLPAEHNIIGTKWFGIKPVLLPRIYSDRGSKLW
jgi:hypothetical protein